MVVRVYEEYPNKDTSKILPLELFGDKIYFDVKDLYEAEEEKGFPGNPDTENDGEIFGWSLTDSWHHLGNVFYFLLSVFNLIDTPKDTSPIIDTKGNIKGKLQYSVSFELLDVDKKTKLNPLEFENMNELIGKNIKLIVFLFHAKDLPEKYTYKTICKYVWNENEYETIEVENSK